MGKRRKQSLKISKRIRPSSLESLKILEHIPLDLIIQILSKLPVKSIARFLCVSKEWNSILVSPDFTDMCLKVSSSCPRLLFDVFVEGKWLFFSSPQPLNPDKNSSPLTIDCHMCFPLLRRNDDDLLPPVNGLLCTGYIKFKRRCTESKVIVSNPSTGQSIPIPIMKGRRSRREYATTYLGYDPINQQYKVLCLSMSLGFVNEHEVLTVGAEKPAWKRIQCSLPRYQRYNHTYSYPICVSGVLYYLGYHGRRETLVCFDVRSEKIKFIKTDDKVKMSSRLINYKGKLGVFPHDGSFNGKTKSLELLVLDDVEKNEWSQHIYVLPPLWKDLVGNMTLHIVGMTGNGELVFSSVVYDPFYLFFYNVDKNTIARVRIH